MAPIADGGHPVRRECSTVHLEWSGRPVSATTSTRRFAPHCCRGDHRRSTSEGSLMTEADGPAVNLSGRRWFGSGVRSFVGRHPVGCYLVVAFVIFWTSWIPVLFVAAPPRLFSAIGAILGLAIPVFLITAATNGRAGVRDLLRRMLRWRIGIGWYVLAMLAIPVGALLLAPLFLGLAPLQGLPQNWTLLFTDFLPQLLLALVTVQLFEELGWAGFVQHRLQPRHGALKASLLVALAFAFLHLPT